MPAFCELICDNCGEKHRREKGECVPETWYTDGWIICSQCWLNVKMLLRPAVANIQEQMPKLFAHLKDPEKKPRVAMNLLVKALQEMQLPRQPSCKAAPQVVE